MATLSDTSDIRAATSRYRVVILGAGRAARGALPSCIHAVSEDSCVLDWLLAAFSELDAPRVCLVAGFRADAVMRRYPSIHFALNPQWDVTGPAHSLSHAPLSATEATYISYSDVVYRRGLIARMERCEADIVLAGDRTWRHRFEGRSSVERRSAEKMRCDDDHVMSIGTELLDAVTTHEFVGVVRLSARASEMLSDALAAGLIDRMAGMPDVITCLLDQGLEARVVDVNGDWAELNASQDLSRFVLGTKAESLERLRQLMRIGQIDDLVAFTRADWNSNADAVIDRILAMFGSDQVIVRSSAVVEDSWHESNAGAFESVLNVSSASIPELCDAIDRVITSYGDGQQQDQVLVQRMLCNVIMSGVVITRTLSLGAPYFIINYDNTTSRTDSVTAGDGRAVQSLVLHHAATPPPDAPAELTRLMDVIKEVIRLVGHDSLDIEFAFTQDGVAHVLQVRPIAVERPDHPVDDECIAGGLARAQRYIRQLQRAAPWILGRRTELNVMTDWNPAEIIGTKPSRLSFTLYRHLITDETWATQRAEYGYRDVRPCNLLIDLLGHPYIDVRATFNSFVPAGLPDRLAERLINFYLDKLAAHPEFHDKVEFDVLMTCLTFDFDDRAAELRQAGFSDLDTLLIRKHLREVTVNGIRRCRHDLSAAVASSRRFEAIVGGDYPPLQRAYLLLEDARLHSVLKFAHLARAGFVAVALLRSLAAVGVTTREQTDAFLSSVRTVSSQMQRDARLVALGSMPWDTFVNTYGHLRPGTYDLTSPHYASAPEDYLRPIVESAGRIRFPFDEPADAWDEPTRAAISGALCELDNGLLLQEFEGFCRCAVEGREFGKFVFTRNLSAALEALAEFGSSHRLSREQLCHVSVQDLLALRSASPIDVGHKLERLVAEGCESWYVTQAVCLPDRIRAACDVVAFEQSPVVPNFVTQRLVRGVLAGLSARTGPRADLTGRIALTPNADPGFDWIFSRGIAGLVTKYGGANSHMAIRAAEFQLPAAIGVGEAMYEQLGSVDMIELDCAGRCIRTIR